jgi:nicotinamidase-related amidase
MLEKSKSCVVVIDVQEKLVRAMHDRDDVIRNTVKIMEGARVLGLPVVCTEQNPKGLGRTVPEVAAVLGDSLPVEKMAFSAVGEPRFLEQIKNLGRKQILLAGIESHVCVYQTAVDLLALGYEVQVVADAVSSRTPENKALGIAKCKESGASLTSVEMALFELLKVAEGDEFKAMLKIVK